MAIAFDAFSSGSVVGTTLTFNHTCTGANRILFVSVTHGTDTTDRITGVTYNSVPMTRVARDVATNGSTYLYYLAAPTAGLNSVVVSCNVSTSVKATSASYTGAKQTGIPDAVSSNSTASATTLAQSVTTIADNAWLIVSSYCTNGSQTATSAGTVRALSSECGIGDSNGAKTPAGSYSGGINWVGATDAVIVIASFAPATGGGGGLTLMNCG